LGLSRDTLSNSSIVVDTTIVPVVWVHMVLPVCKIMSLMRTKRDNPKLDITHCRRQRGMMGHAKIFHVTVL